MYLDFSFKVSRALDLAVSAFELFLILGYTRNKGINSIVSEYLNYMIKIEKKTAIG